MAFSSQVPLQQMLKGASNKKQDAHEELLFGDTMKNANPIPTILLHKRMSLITFNARSL